MTRRVACRAVSEAYDQVVGVDFHDIQVPSNSGLTTVPMIPHPGCIGEQETKFLTSPYLGKLADNLSEDVKIGGAVAAFKGSTSKFDTPGHIPMPRMLARAVTKLRPGTRG